MANEKRLIAVDSIKREQKNILFMGRNAGKMRTMLNDIVTLMIANCPTVDAVEVVRCKDCKHRGDDVHCPMCYEEEIEWDDDGYTEVDWILHDRTKDEGFCDRGERREGE